MNDDQPPERETEEDAWEYWHQKAITLEAKLIFARRLTREVAAALGSAEANEIARLEEFIREREVDRRRMQKALSDIGEWIALHQSEPEGKKIHDGVFHLVIEGMGGC